MPLRIKSNLRRNYNFLYAFLSPKLELSVSNMADAKPQGPFKLVTVNTAPERAKRLIGRVVEDVKAEYTIIYAANAESTSPPPPDLPKPSFPWGDEEAQLLTGKLAIDEVKNMVEKNQPDVLVSTPVLNLLGVSEY